MFAYLLLAQSGSWSRAGASTAVAFTFVNDKGLKDDCVH